MPVITWNWKLSGDIGYNYAIGEIMTEPKRELKGYLGLVIVCIVILVFMALASCQADFFMNMDLLL